MSETIDELIEAKKVFPIKIEKMPLEKAAEAQELNETRHGKGKIVVKI